MTELYPFPLTPPPMQADKVFMSTFYVHVGIRPLMYFGASHFYQFTILCVSRLPGEYKLS